MTMTNTPIPPLPFDKRDAPVPLTIEEEDVLDGDANAEHIDSAEADRLAAEGRVKESDAPHE